jgi:hypothetical protein
MSTSVSIEKWRFKPAILIKQTVNCKFNDSQESVPGSLIYNGLQDGHIGWILPEFVFPAIVTNNGAF